MKLSDRSSCSKTRKPRLGWGQLIGVLTVSSKGEGSLEGSGVDENKSDITVEVIANYG
jgi:hypothetical protein